MNIFMLIGAVFFICLGHLIRVIRWELFVKVYEKPKRSNLLLSLSCGYILNCIVPYKMGDVVRAYMAGKKMKNGKALSFSTVVVDRYLDILSVGFIFIFLSFNNSENVVVGKSVLYYIVTTGILLGLTVIIYFFKGIVKKVFRLIASIFNSKIEVKLLCFAWSLIWNFKDIVLNINKVKLLLTTIVMWILYLISYYFFASFITTLGIGKSWTDIFTILFAENGIKSSTGSILEMNKLYANYMLIYMILPLLIILLISCVMKKEKQTSDVNEYINLIPHLEPKERLRFLESYFSGDNKEYVNNYLKINRGISIIRDYSAGSNATTMLCINEQGTFFRKYAFGEDGEKLYNQIVWINNNNKRIAVPEILQYDKTDLYCYYDMSYNNNAVRLFEYVHSMPLEKGWDIVQRVLNTLENTLYKTDIKKVDNFSIKKYIDNKVEKNLIIIKNTKRIKRLQHYKEIIINGIPYRNLSYYEQYMKEEYLLEVFRNDIYATIHGDLTIENIICIRNATGKDEFYVIDPNTDNIHESPNLDYGKLLQSIHGGYEFLMAVKEVEVKENKIDFLFTKSSVYVELHRLLKKYIYEKFGAECMRSIYFHEIIHWLRLIPYKIEKDEKRALLFYAGMLIVMSDVISEVEDGTKE